MKSAAHRHITHLTRREMLRRTAAVLAIPAISTRTRSDEEKPKYAPVRTITRGPKHHWFGYYDKLEFDPTNRHVLANEVSFEHRTPRQDDVINVGMVDTARNDAWMELGQSRAWGWQQGCMLQWRPGSKSEVIWNDREGDRFVCRVHDVKTGKKRTLPRPLYTLSPDGKYGLSVDFARIQDMRPGYGYVGLQDPHGKDRAPRDSGVWRVDLETGKDELILTLADVARIPHFGSSLEGFWHYFNHLLINPAGTRFIVLHRWRKAKAREGTGGFITRMFTVGMDGSSRFILDPSGNTSHFIWRDPEHICAWTRPRGKKAAFYLFRDQTREVEIVGDGIMARNGHNTYLAGTDNEWILNDTYPDSTRHQTLYLYHVPTRRRVVLGRFLLPKVFRGEWRCDLHPRSSNDGKTVAIDSPHTGKGRQIHLVDVSGIVG